LGSLKFKRFKKGIIIYYNIKKGKMKVTKKIIKVGTSDGIVIDKPIMKDLKLKTGDLVEADLNKPKKKK
jgi:hypothetical protein